MVHVFLYQYLHCVVLFYPFYAVTIHYFAFWVGFKRPLHLAPCANAFRRGHIAWVQHDQRNRRSKRRRQALWKSKFRRGRGAEGKGGLPSWQEWQQQQQQSNKPEETNALSSLIARYARRGHPPE